MSAIYIEVKFTFVHIGRAYMFIQSYGSDYRIVISSFI